MDADTILRKVLETIAEEHSYRDHDIKIEPINSGGANYTSTLFQASVAAPSRKQLQLFAKVATVGKKMREQMDCNKMFQTENYFYTRLMKQYEAIQDKHEVCGDDRLVFPKFYGHDATVMQETIVLEDLTASGFRSYDRFKVYDWEYAAASVTQLAKFHALSLALQEEDPEKFDQILAERKYEIPENREDNVFKQLLSTAFQAVKPEFAAKLQKFMEGLKVEDFMQYYSPRRKPVLVHGDYRPSNLMSRRQGDHLEVIPVDYQTIHAGCAAHDLIYFIYVGSDRAFRQKHFQQLVDLYYRQLDLAVHRLGNNLETLYPRTTFDQDFNDGLTFGLTLALYILPMVTVEEENAPKMDDNFESNCGDIKPTEVYKERLNGIVEEFIERGLL